MTAQFTSRRPDLVIAAGLAAVALAAFAGLGAGLTGVALVALGATAEARRLWGESPLLCFQAAVYLSLYALFAGAAFGGIDPTPLTSRVDLVASVAVIALQGPLLFQRGPIAG